MKRVGYGATVKLRSAPVRPPISGGGAATSAGSGIGRAAAMAFAREGAQVVVSDVVAEGGTETLRLIEEAGGKGHVHQGDVAVAADVQALVRAVEKRSSTRPRLPAWLGSRTSPRTTRPKAV